MYLQRTWATFNKNIFNAAQIKRKLMIGEQNFNSLFVHLFIRFSRWFLYVFKCNLMISKVNSSRANSVKNKWSQSPKVHKKQSKMKR